MVSTLRIALMVLVGGGLGFLLSLILVILFVDMDMVLPFYVGGMILGAVIGATYGIYSHRRHRAPAA